MASTVNEEKGKSGLLLKLSVAGIAALAIGYWVVGYINDPLGSAVEDKGGRISIRAPVGWEVHQNDPGPLALIFFKGEGKYAPHLYVTLLGKGDATDAKAKSLATIEKADKEVSGWKIVREDDYDVGEHVWHQQVFMLPGNVDRLVEGRLHLIGAIDGVLVKVHVEEDPGALLEHAALYRASADSIKFLK